jgi:hypothetical protein
MRLSYKETKTNFKKKKDNQCESKESYD